MTCIISQTFEFHDQVCTNFSLGKCPFCSKGKTCPSYDSSNKRKQPCNNESSIEGARKMARNKKKLKEERKWGYTTNLKLYDDPWKITKELTSSDLGNLSRLLLHKDIVEDLVIPVLGTEARMKAQTERETKIMIWDVNTQSVHYLVFKQWISSRSYVFIDNWNKDFVNRRSLKKGDEIGFHWDPYKNCFDFIVLFGA